MNRATGIQSPSVRSASFCLVFFTVVVWTDAAIAQQYRRSYDPYRGWSTWRSSPTSASNSARFQQRGRRGETATNWSDRNRRNEARNERSADDLTFRERQYRDWLYRDPHTYDPWGFEEPGVTGPDHMWLDRRWARDRGIWQDGRNQRTAESRDRGDRRGPSPRDGFDEFGPDGIGDAEFAGEWRDEWREQDRVGIGRRDFQDRRFGRGLFDDRAAPAREYARDFDESAAIGDLGLDTEASMQLRNPGGFRTSEDYRRSWIDPGRLGGQRSLGGPPFGDAGFSTGLGPPEIGGTGLDDGTGFGAGNGFGGAFGSGVFDSGVGSGIAGPGVGRSRLGTAGGLGGGGFDTLGGVGGSIGAPGAGIE